MSQLYNQEDLDSLWEIIKYSRTDSEAPHYGLKEVPFFKELLDFFNDNHQRHKPFIRKNLVSRVITDLKNLFDILDKANVRLHHLTCAGEGRGAKENSGLCIHCLNHTTGNVEIYTVPGVNYRL